MRPLFTAQTRLITFSVFSSLSFLCCLMQQKQTSCCFHGCGRSLFLRGASLRIDVPSLTPTPVLRRHVSREELWEKLCHVEVSKMQICPTPGTFYFCFSDSQGHTRLGDLLNKTPRGDLGINKHSRRIYKVRRNCQTSHAISRCR